MEGDIVSRRIKATEGTTLAKLSMLDQLKMLLHKFNNNEVAELDAAEKVSRNSLRMRAALQRLFLTAVEGLDEGKHESVTLQVSSKFLPYLDAVIDKNRGMGQYYDFNVVKRDLPINVEFMFMVTITRKVT